VRVHVSGCVILCNLDCTPTHRRKEGFCHAREKAPTLSRYTDGGRCRPREETPDQHRSTPFVHTIVQAYGF